MRHTLTLVCAALLALPACQAGAAGVAMTWANTAGSGTISGGGPTVPTPVSSWCFTGSNGDDCTGTFDFTTINGSPTYADAGTPKGNMAELDGTDCFRENDANFLVSNSVNDAFTYTGWFKSDSVTKSEIFAINEIYTEARTLFLLEVQDDGDYKMRLQAGAASSWTTDTYESNNVARFVAGRWIFYAITFDGSDGSVTLHIDNTTDQSSLTEVFNTTHSQGSGVTVPDCPEDACISFYRDSLMGCRNGSSNGTDNNPLTGDIADIRLFDGVLTTTEMEAVRDDQ